MLNHRQAGYLNYFERLATQPPNRWDGFSLDDNQQESIFGLRFQIAFACYALGALCLHPDSEDEERDRCHQAMVALIERMLQRRVWAYWAKSAERRGISPDPIERGNADYSAHLAMMIGVLEVVCGDYRYDEPFNLLWTSTERFTYTHHSLVEALWQQMRRNKHHGIDSEPGRTYTTAMCAAVWANLFHDWKHGSTYAEANGEWLAFVQRRMVLRGPRALNGGIFSPFYRPRLGLGAPTGSSLVDAWILAMLAPIAPELTSKFAPRFLQILRDDEATTSSMRSVHVPPDRLFFAAQEADQALSNAFAYVLAVELNETQVADALLRHADREFLPVELEQARYYTGGTATPSTTALFALGEAGGLQPLAQTERASPATADAEATDGPPPFTEDDEYAVLIPSEPEEDAPDDDAAPGWAGTTGSEPFFTHAEHQPAQLPLATDAHTEQPDDALPDQHAPDDSDHAHASERDTQYTEPEPALSTNDNGSDDDAAERHQEPAPSRADADEPQPALSTQGSADDDATEHHQNTTSPAAGADDADDAAQLQDGTVQDGETQPDNDDDQQPVASMAQQPEKPAPSGKSRRKRTGSRKKKSTDTSE